MPTEDEGTPTPSLPIFQACVQWYQQCLIGAGGLRPQRLRACGFWTEILAPAPARTFLSYKVALKCPLHFPKKKEMFI